MWTPDWVASELLRRARMDDGDLFSLEMVAMALGFRLVVASGPALHGTAVPGMIVYDGTRRTLAHELGHVACALAGLPLPHDEKFVASVAVCLIVPARVVDRALKAGMERVQISNLFGVSHTCSVLRRAECERRPVAVITPTKM